MSQQINLFNPVFLKQKKHFSALAMLQALALVLTGMAALHGYGIWQIGKLERVFADAERELSERRARVLRISKEFSPQGRNKQLEDEVVRVEGILRRRQELLSELKTGAGGNVEGFSRYLSALARQSIQGVWLTSIAFGGQANELVIKGRALNGELVPPYVSSLGKDPALAGRPVSALQLSARTDAAAKSGPGSFVEFTLSIPLRGSEAGSAPAPQKGAS
jgi:hypothetical protein